MSGSYPSFRPCIVIPVFNHAMAVPLMLAQIREQMPLIPVLLINDGSDERCTSVLRELQLKDPHIELLEFAVNSGKGAAVKAGLARAEAMGFSHGLQLDADGQHDAQDIPIFLQSAADTPDAIIAGVPQFDESVPTLRLYARYLTHVMVWVNSLSLQVRDGMCGFRVYPLQRVNQLISSEAMGDRMDFDPELMVRWCWRAWPLKSLQTHVKYPLDGLSHFRMFEDNFLITRMHTRLFLLMLIKSPMILWRRYG